MNEEIVREHAERHGRAVMENDVARIKADLIDELHPAIAGISAIVPQPLESAVVRSVAIFDGYAETVIEYGNPAATIKMKSRWEDRGSGQLQIVEATPA